MPPRKRPAAAPGSLTKRTARAPATITNPILPGGFPDPSICRVGEYFYLANSSFEYFPGIPLHRSKDLVNWEWVGYGLHQEDQVRGAVNLVDVKSQDGIQAPSLRHHNGTFYIITTCVYRPPDVEEGTCTNFIITAQDISGPWSEPHVIEGAPGIDPDIFFDDDGKVWYVGTHPPHEKPNFAGEGEIWCQELDLVKWCLVGERHYLWRGACYGGVFVEGPHLYKHEGQYYLLVAEGGTGVNHAVMVASSDKVTGPYLPNERNPMLTSRHLSYDNWVHSTGHADLFQVPDGRWYMVLLGVRADAGPSMNRRSNMGRETFLVPVTWEQEPMEWSPLGPHIKHLWPVAAPKTGRVERTLPPPFEAAPPAPPHQYFDDFAEAALGPEWNFRRVPKAGTYSLAARPSFLRLYASPVVIKERAACSLLGVRQRESDFSYSACMNFTVAEGSPVQAGICLFQKDDAYIAYMLSRNSGPWTLSLVVATAGAEARCVQSAPVPTYSGAMDLRVTASADGYCFSYTIGKRSEDFASTAADLILSFGYTGAYLGLYCTTTGEAAQRDTDYADFDWISHQAAPRSAQD